MSNEQYYGFFFSLNGNAVNKSKMELAETLAESIAMALSTKDGSKIAVQSRHFCVLEWPVSANLVGRLLIGV